MSISGSQIRAARGFVRWSAQDLAKASGVGIATIHRAEAVDGPPPLMRANLEVIRRALEAAGVEFIPENGGGAGVRMRKPTPATDLPG